MFVLIKDIANNKASSTSESNTHKLKWVLFLIIDCGRVAICPEFPGHVRNFGVNTCPEII